MSRSSCKETSRFSPWKLAPKYDDLNSEDRLKALVFRKSAEDGEYSGDPVTEDRCDSIRKLLFLR
jgi:hypothetical protein